jgi:hypothetical protein
MCCLVIVNVSVWLDMHYLKKTVNLFMQTREVIITAWYILCLLAKKIQKFASEWFLIVCTVLIFCREMFNIFLERKTQSNDKIIQM